MSKTLFSASWYRVADIKPRLRSNARIHRQQFRGEVWYVMQDQASGRFHRFSPAANVVIGLMDGERTVQEIWDLACTQLEEDILTQDETIQLLSKLHMSEVLQGDVPPDLAEMVERADSQARKKMVFSLLNPMAVRIPMLDPERFLSATFPLVRPLFTWFGFILLFGFIATGTVVAA
ncbi:MAG: peptidase M50, partial [Pseudomonadota bacterium]